jgi:hypothetical protein
MKKLKQPDFLVRSLALALLGGLTFWGNSSLDIPYFAKGYITLIEIQGTLALLYFFMFKSNNRIQLGETHEK